MLDHFLRGVEAIHKMGMAHLDLKLGNVLVVRDNKQMWSQAKIIDFGLARMADEKDGKQLQGLNGTPGYMSPRLKGLYGHDVDLFAAGIVSILLLLQTEESGKKICIEHWNTEERSNLTANIGTVNIDKLKALNHLIDNNLANSAVKKFISTVIERILIPHLTPKFSWETIDNEIETASDLLTNYMKVRQPFLGVLNNEPEHDIKKRNRKFNAKKKNVARNEVRKPKNKNQSKNIGQHPKRQKI